MRAVPGVFSLGLRRR